MRKIILALILGFILALPVVFAQDNNETPEPELISADTEEITATPEDLATAGSNRPRRFLPANGRRRLFGELEVYRKQFLRIEIIKRRMKSYVSS